uniref:Uncharacterized protein n=2 Tax=Magallana gigas TaxID=29159 RepID=K1PGB6_MAGGI
MLKFDDRFARQNRCGPPSEFPLTSSYSSIVHHLSGTNVYALAPPLRRSANGTGRWCAPAATDRGSHLGRTRGCLHFHYAFRFRNTQ